MQLCAEVPRGIPTMDIYSTYSSREVDQVVCLLWDTKEILTDQGTNFNSQLLQKLYEILGVKAINTSLHHLQTDGLVECFNQTLKSMLKQVLARESHD